MKITAMIDRGKWAIELEKLRDAMGVTMTEVVKGQAKLLCRDAVKLTPPIVGGKKNYKPYTEGFPKQLEAGVKALRKDILRVFRPAVLYWSLTTDKDGNKPTLAKAVAKLARNGDVAGLKKILPKNLRLDRIKDVVKQADPNYYEMTRMKSRGRPSPRFPGVLVHRGTVPNWQNVRDKKNLTTYGGIDKIFKAKVKNIGFAKAGWVKSMDQLGGKPGWAPRWVRRHAAKAATGRVLRLVKSAKASVTVGNGVPYIQAAGEELRLIQNLMRNRMRNIGKQIEQTIRANKRAQKVGVK